MVQKRSEQITQALHGLVENSRDINGVAVISMDGLVIAAELPPRRDQARVGAVAASILNLANRSVSQLVEGQLTQTLIQGTEGNIIITYASKNAVFVALTVKDVNLGMAFLEVQEGAQSIAAILG